jgi:hypothetical protein
MEYDTAKLEETVLALLGAFEFEDGRAWKQMHGRQLHFTDRTLGTVAWPAPVDQKRTRAMARAQIDPGQATSCTPGLTC